MRIGHGVDVHRLVEGRALILCGVRVPFDKGLLGHSDADVATHALMDALLGAAALGDIGKLFPDTDEAYRGADSLRLLDTVVLRLAALGFSPANVDVTIMMQLPKLRPYIDQMRENLAARLRLPVSRVSVKATTTEGLGYEGEGAGVTAHAVCLLNEAE
jgi:2-C-methyl-D-erythritol 2,4-cyclodiphosphate synthase